MKTNNKQSHKLSQTLTSSELDTFGSLVISGTSLLFMFSMELPTNSKSFSLIFYFVQLRVYATSDRFERVSNTDEKISCKHISAWVSLISQLFHVMFVLSDVYCDRV